MIKPEFRKAVAGQLRILFEQNGPQALLNVLSGRSESINVGIWVSLSAFLRIPRDLLRVAVVTDHELHYVLGICVVGPR